MSNDKKISELTPYTGITGNELGVLSDSTADYSFTFSVLLQYLSSNVTNRTTTAFGTVLPQNTEGQNGDIFINTAQNSFAQKINGVWVTKYQQQISPATTLFGLAPPDNATGSDNQVYISTSTGVFYKKSNGVWGQVFSMQTGPAGPPGNKGDTGAAGADGATILSGTTNPSNLLTGKNGDYYINTSIWSIFGPKTAGAWPAGVSLIQGANYTPVLVSIHAGVTPTPLVCNYTGDAGADPIPVVKLKNGDGSFTYDNNVSVSQSADGKTYTVNGQPDANGKFMFSYLFTLYPGSSSVPATPSPANGALPYSLPIQLH